MRKTLSLIWETLKVLIIAAAIVVPVRYFIFQPFVVRGQSMEPNFENGDYLIVDELSYKLRGPQRGEVVVFKYPQDPSQRFIKRIIGLPGETVEIKNGKIAILKNSSSEALDESTYLPIGSTPGEIREILGNNEYFVLGDNRPASFDSRRWGPLDKDYIIGRVFFRVWPFAALAKFGAPIY